MTCQHCQTQNFETQILDDDYRCRRCGSRVRSTPSRPSSDRFPVQSTAAARDYELEYEPLEQVDQSQIGGNPEPLRVEQARLFEGSGTDARVIAFDSITNRAERQSIHARAAGLIRPEPLKTEKVQVKRARSAKRSTAARPHHIAKVSHYDQGRLEFQGQDDIQAAPRPSIICDALVAPTLLRLEATLIDGFIIAIPCCFAILLFWCLGGSSSVGDKYSLLLFLAALATIPFFYKLLWTFAGSDSIGMQRAGLQLVDFDGNPPSQSRRYQRLAGSLLSLLAGGVGLIWSLVDEDRLTWHDHISNSFPTLVDDDLSD